MLRVALLSWSMIPTSGWGTFTYGLCCELAKRDDIEIELHLPVDSDPDSSLTTPFPVYRTLPRYRGSFSHRPHRIAPYIWPRFKLDQVDVIHSLIEFPYGILARNLARTHKVPFVVTTQGTYAVTPMLNWFDRWNYKPVFRDAALVTAPSSFTVDALRWASGLNPNVQIIHNAVEYERFQAPADLAGLRMKYNLPKDARIILGVGALKDRKGFDLLIEAFARVVEKEQRARLVIVGGGDRQPLENLTSSLGVDKQTQILGEVPGDDLVGLYQTCEVYSHLPRNTQWSFEGYGIVYLEAGACGKPVVATRSGGVPDAVVDGETGFLVDEEDADGVAAALIRLLGDTQLAHSMGEAGRKYAEQHTWAWYSGQIVDCYNDVVFDYRSQRTEK
jgi:phosphatidylinositol alpha-1,6-mannosyltransferase